MTQALPIFDEAVFQKVLDRLNPVQTCRVLDLLRVCIVEVSELSERELRSSVGRELAHRLTAEAGFLGFARLSKLCASLDGRDGLPSRDVAEAYRDLQGELENAHTEVRSLLARLANWDAGEPAGRARPGPE